MSSYVNKNGFYNRIYSLSYTSEIKNVSDLIPLQRYIKRHGKDLVLLCSNVHFRVFEIFSPTMFDLNADTCPKLESIMNTFSMKIFPNAHLPKHPEIKTVLRQSNEIVKQFPQDFKLIDSKVIVVNNKVLLKFKLLKEVAESYESLVQELNDFFGTRKKPCYTILLALVVEDEHKQPVFSSPKKEIMTEIAPKKIYIKGPLLREHVHIDNYSDYNF